MTSWSFGVSNPQQGELGLVEIVRELRGEVDRWIDSAVRMLRNASAAAKLHAPGDAIPTEAGSDRQLPTESNLIPRTRPRTASERSADRQPPPWEASSTSRFGNFQESSSQADTDSRLDALAKRLEGNLRHSSRRGSREDDLIVRSEIGTDGGGGSERPGADR